MTNSVQYVSLAKAVAPMRAAGLHVDVFQLHVKRFCQHFAIGKSEAVFNPGASFL